MSERAALFGLAWKSLLNRRLTAGLIVASVAMSVMLLVAVDRIRTETKASFVNTISGVDLVVGARGGPLNLLLYAVFRVGDATSNISWESYQLIAEPAGSGVERAAVLGRRAQGIPRAGHHRRLLRTLPLRPRSRSWRSRSASRSPVRGKQCSARKWQRRWTMRWATRSWCRTASAMLASCITTTRPSRSPASWRTPARRWIAPFT